MDIAHLQSWIGKSETRHECIAPVPSNALAATLDRDDPPYEEGTALPPLWHWLHFLPIFKLSDAGYDGHQALGDFLPPVPLPRRMWAGSRFVFHALLHIGETLQKTSTVQSVTHKTGRSGDLVFVTVKHLISCGDRIGIDEEHDIVYRDAATPGSVPPPPPMAPHRDDFSRKIDPGPVLLFRYSALTFNGHRIHYDHPFCTGTEGYDGLVVHGPLLATLLLDLLRRQYPDRAVARFDFRAISTVTADHPFSVHGAQSPEGGFRLWVRRHDGALAMEATARLKDV